MDDEALCVSGAPGDSDGAPQLRTPPHSEEAEHGVLGALLQDNTCMAVVATYLTGASFYRHANRLIFEAAAELLQERKPVDVVSVFQLLESRGQAVDSGGLAYINALYQCVPSARNAKHHAEIVAEKAAERVLIARLDDAQTIAWQTGEPLDDRLERISAMLHSAEQHRKAPAGRRVPMLKLAALREASMAVRWLCKRVVPADSIGMMFGGSGTFKSFIALDLALHVAHGLPWMGRRTHQGQVLFIAAEGGAGLWPRIHAWHKERGLHWQGAPVFVVPAAVDLTADAWRVVDAAQLVGVAPTLVVVDTLSQTYNGEENSANEMAAYLRELGARFRQLWQCAVLLVHHSGHQATERPRGSSAIRANLDFLLGVFRDEKEMLATVSCIKQKDGELFDDAVFGLSVSKLGHDDEGDEITSLVARHLSTADERDRARQAEADAGRGGRNHMFTRLINSGMREHELRKAFYEDLGDMETDSKKKAYQRCRKWAIASGLIDMAEGIVIDLRKPK
jgi:AAA domain/DnaB-like helicase N terminal domain